jgi:hypothetical protein
VLSTIPAIFIMEGLLQHGSSFYHRLVLTFTRALDGRLLTYNGPGAGHLIQNWANFAEHFVIGRPAVHGHHTFQTKFVRTGHAEDESPIDVVVYEQMNHDDSCVVGIIVKTINAPTPTSDDAFFLDLAFEGSDASDLVVPLRSHELASITAEQVTNLFDTTLRYITAQDKWHSSGREYFLQRVLYYTSRALPIELCLPAFPCKSSNFDKVTGVPPDRGEHIALNTLHSFLRHVGEIYRPGATLWIISDGHVFSDCSELALLLSPFLSDLLTQCNSRSGRHSR